MFETMPKDRTGWGPCFSDSAANIFQRQISSVLLSRTSEDVITVFQSCLTARAEPDRGIVGLKFLDAKITEAYQHPDQHSENDRLVLFSKPIPVRLKTRHAAKVK